MGKMLVHLKFALQILDGPAGKLQTVNDIGTKRSGESERNMCLFSNLCFEIPDSRNNFFTFSIFLMNKNIQSPVKKSFS